MKTDQRHLLLPDGLPPPEGDAALIMVRLAPFGAHGAVTPNDAMHFLAREIGVVRERSTIDAMLAQLLQRGLLTKNEHSGSTLPDYDCGPGGADEWFITTSLGRKAAQLCLWLTKPHNTIASPSRDGGELEDVAILVIGSSRAAFDRIDAACCCVTTEETRRMLDSMVKQGLIRCIEDEKFVLLPHGVVRHRRLLALRDRSPNNPLNQFVAALRNEIVTHVATPRTDGGRIKVAKVAHSSSTDASSSLGLLHLTDLHQGTTSQGWLWPNVRDLFFADLRHIHDRCGPWDAVVFTGDLTNRGTTQEFDDLENTLSQLFAHLRDLGSDPVLMTVPGNHDLVRPDPRSTNNRSPLRALRQWQEDAPLRDEVLEDPADPCREMITTAFAPYTDWRRRSLLPCLEQSDGLLPGDFAATLEHGALRLGLVGLNTSFLQLTDDSYDGLLDVDPRQLQAVCGGRVQDWVGRHTAALLLTHHPPSWLHPQARERFIDGVAPPGRFLTHLCGHLHEPSAQSVSIGGAPVQRLSQGTSLFGLESYRDPRKGICSRRHGYSALRIERLDNGDLRLRTWPRALVPRMAGHREMDKDPGFTLDADEAYTEVAPYRSR